MKGPDELKQKPFPDCYKECKAGYYLGVGECEACCPKKFDDKGDPIKKPHSHCNASKGR